MSCDENGNPLVFHKNRTVSDKICFLASFLSGKMAYFAIFFRLFGFSWKSPRFRINLSSFHGMENAWIFSKNRDIWEHDLMSTHYLGIDSWKMEKTAYQDKKSVVV